MATYKNDNVVHLEEALHSLNSQTAIPGELLIVFDGVVPDEIESAVSKFKEVADFPINVVRLECNLGLAKALKVGVEKCKYNLIARMDSDDISNEDRFEKQLAEFQSDPELEVVGGRILEFNDYYNDKNIRNVPLSYPEIKSSLPYKSPFNHVTVMFKKDLIIRVGNYKNFRGIEDLALWFDVVNSSRNLKNISDVLVRVRVNPGFVDRRSGLSYARQELRVYIYAWKRKYISLLVFVSVIMLRVPVRLLPKSLVAFLYKLKRHFE